MRYEEDQEQCLSAQMVVFAIQPETAARVCSLKFRLDAFPAGSFGRDCATMFAKVAEYYRRTGKVFLAYIDKVEDKSNELGFSAAELGIYERARCEELNITGTLPQRLNRVLMEFGERLKAQRLRELISGHGWLLREGQAAAFARAVLPEMRKIMSYVPIWDGPDLAKAPTPRKASTPKPAAKKSRDEILSLKMITLALMPETAGKVCGYTFPKEAFADANRQPYSLAFNILSQYYRRFAGSVATDTDFLEELGKLLRANATTEGEMFNACHIAMDARDIADPRGQDDMLAQGFEPIAPDDCESVLREFCDRLKAKQLLAAIGRHASAFKEDHASEFCDAFLPEADSILSRYTVIETHPEKMPEIPPVRLPEIRPTHTEPPEKRLRPTVPLEPQAVEEGPDLEHLFSTTPEEDSLTHLFDDDLPVDNSICLQLSPLEGDYDCLGPMKLWPWDSFLEKGPGKSGI